jgi:hypothetical protein
LQLRERLLLLVRALVCGVIAIALAKPFTSCDRKGPMVTRGPQAAVIVIDDSFSSGYLVDGKPWLRTAIGEARRVMIQLGPEAEIAIVRTSEGADHPGELTRDHVRVRDQLMALEPSSRPADTTRALSRAAQLLAASSHSRKTVFLFSLLSKNSFHSDEAPWGKDGPQLQTIDLRPDKIANLAITALRVDPDPGAGSRGMAFDAEVGNFSETAATVELQLAIADRVVARGSSGSSPRFPRARVPPMRTSRSAATRWRSTTVAGSTHRCATTSACCSSTVTHAPFATTTSCSICRPRFVPATAMTAGRRSE